MSDVQTELSEQIAEQNHIESTGCKLTETEREAAAIVVCINKLQAIANNIRGESCSRCLFAVTASTTFTAMAGCT